MANRKISDLTALTAPATGDLLPIVDISEAAAADKNKKITYGELLASAPAGSAAAPSFSFDGDPNSGLYSAGADQVAISTNGTGRLFVDASGRVGVGTTSPQQLLHLNGSSGAQVQFTDSGTGASATDGLRVGWNGTEGQIYLFENADLRFATNDQERARIDSSGRLGIGTSAPDGLLHVASASAGTVTANGNANELVVENSSTGGISILTPDANHGYLIFGSPSDNEGAIIRYRHSDGIYTIGTEATGGSIQLRSGSGTTALTIDSSQRVGIGTTLVGNSANQLSVRRDSANNIVDALLLNNGSVDNAAGTGVRINFSGVQESNSDIRYAYIESATSSIGNDHYIAFGTNAAGVTPVERARIDSSGRLLVGTSSGRGVATDAVANLSVEIAPGTGAAGATASFVRNSNDTAGAIFSLGKSRSSSVGNLIVASGDALGELRFAGADNTDLQSIAASINCFVDGTPGANDMPGRIVLSTTADGASSPTERMRIDCSGNIGIGRTPQTKLDVVGQIRASAAATQDGVMLQGRAGGTSSYEAILTPATLTADRTLTLPDTTGTLITSGDAGTVTGTMLQLGAPQVVSLTSTQASTSVTLANVTELVVSLAANAIYEVDCYVTFRSAATTTGLRLGFTSPTGCIPMVEVVVPIVSTASANALRLTFPSAASTTSGVVVGTGVTATNSNHTARISGIIKNGSTAGDFQVQFGTEVAASAVTLQIGSTMQLTRVA